MQQIYFFLRKSGTRLAVISAIVLSLTACVGTLVGAVVDTAIEIVKVPFKVGGAIIDVATPNDKFTNLNESHIKQDRSRKPVKSKESKESKES